MSLILLASIYCKSTSSLHAGTTWTDSKGINHNDLHNWQETIVLRKWAISGLSDDAKVNRTQLLSIHMMGMIAMELRMCVNLNLSLKSNLDR